MNESLIGRVVKWVLIAGAVGIVGAIGVALWLRFSDGRPPDISDLAPKRVSIPDGENGFLDLNGSRSQAQLYEDAGLEHWLVRDGWDQKKVDVLLVQNQAALASLDASLAKPGFKYKGGGTYPSLYAPGQTKLAEVKILSSINHWNQGQKNLAVKEDLQALEFGRRIETCGNDMWTYMGGVDVEIEALDNLGRFASEASGEELREMKSAVDKFEQDVDHTEAFRDALKDEADEFNKIFDRIASGNADISSLLYGKPVAPIEKIFQPNNTRRMFAETIRQMIRDAPLTYDKIDKEPGALKVVTKMSPRQRLLSFNIGGYMVFIYHFSDCTSWSAAKCRIVTQVGMTRTLIAARMYWLDHGKLPAMLDDLVPGYLKAVPLDAFDGKPLQYSAEQKIIYSVGEWSAPGIGEMPGEDILGLGSQPKMKIGW